MTGSLVRIFASWLFGIALLSAPQTAEAAEVRTVAGGGVKNPSHLNEAYRLSCSHRLEGPIASGDVARVEQALGGFADFPVMCFDSPGGSFAEGIELAKLFQTRGIITLVEDGKECLSACGIAFLGGSYEMLGTTTLRAIQPGARLGFHAPSIELPDGTYSNDIVEGSYGAALQHINVAIRAFGLPDDTGQVLLPNALLVEMLMTPPESIRFVETVNDAAMWDIDIAANLVARDATAFTLQACFNGFHWAAGRPAPVPGAGDLDALTVETGEYGAFRIVSRPGTDVEAHCEMHPDHLAGMGVSGIHSTRMSFTSLAHGAVGTTRLDALK